VRGRAHLVSTLNCSLLEGTGFEGFGDEGGGNRDLRAGYSKGKGGREDSRGALSLRGYWNGSTEVCTGKAEGTTSRNEVL